MTPIEVAHQANEEADLSWADGAPVAQAPPPLCPPPGLYRGVPFDVYRGWQALNHSVLKEYARSAAHGRHVELYGLEDTAAMRRGRALHALVLEGAAAFERGFVVKPEGLSLSTKEGKAWKAEVGLRTVLSAEDGARVRGMARSLLSHDTASAFLEAPGLSEASIRWDEQDESGQRLPCKARLDRVCALTGETFIVDVKTTAEDVRLAPFSRYAGKYGLFTQALWYSRGAAAVAGPRDRTFVFLAVESDPPHGVMAYTPGSDELADAAIELQRALEVYREARRIQSWPGYPLGLQILTAPWRRTNRVPEEE